MIEASFRIMDFPLVFFCPRKASIMIDLRMWLKLVYVFAFCVRKLGTKSVLGIYLVVTSSGMAAGYEEMLEVEEAHGTPKSC